MKILRALFNWKMLIIFLMGFSSGVPLLLVGSTLKLWARRSGMEIEWIGYLGLLMLPYTFKFLLAPFVDRYTFRFGRRRSWMLFSQIGLIITLWGLSETDPSHQFTPFFVAGFLVALFSAIQDIAIDAYRREFLPEFELALGNSLAVAGYRVAIIFSGAFALLIAADHSWSLTYKIMAVGILVGFGVTLFAPEPKNVSNPRNLREAFIEPFKEFFSRQGPWWILAFIFFYKVGDSMAGQFFSPLYVDVGFSNEQIAYVVKLFGIWTSILGGILGGAVVLKLGLRRSLWFFGFLQAISTAGFALLPSLGPQTWVLAAVVSFESVTGGLGTAAYVAFMQLQTNKRFTGTQYALFTSLMSLPNSILGVASGYMVKYLGYEIFFIFCTVAAVPGLLLIFKVGRWAETKTIDDVKDPVAGV